MELKDNLKQINDLQKKIQSFGKLNDELLRKIEYRFRLDWNYFSNNMEGNTLTRRETRTVMAGMVTVKDKPIKDVLEMRGHDETIHKILKMAGGEMNVSESRIKEIHRGIMFEDIEERKKWVSEWKTEDNVVTNYKDEVYKFSSHLDVKEEIHALVNWLNAESDKIKAAKSGALNPVILAFEFHLRFLTIHPFYDGNGRVSRILMNIILLSFGFPAVIIRKEDGEEKAYYRYLGDVQAYGAPPVDYYSFMCGLVIRSQNLVLDAIDGKDITGPEDLDKEIALFRSEFSVESKSKNFVERSEEVDKRVKKEVVIPILQMLEIKIRSLEDLFFDKRRNIIFNDKEEYEEKGVGEIPTQLLFNDFYPSIYKIIHQIELIGFKALGLKSFNSIATVIFEFEKFGYSIFSGDNKIKIVHSYNEIATQREINELVAHEVKSVMDQIRANTQKKD